MAASEDRTSQGTRKPQDQQLTNAEESKQRHSCHTGARDCLSNLTCLPRRTPADGTPGDGPAVLVLRHSKPPPDRKAPNHPPIRRTRARPLGPTASSTRSRRSDDTRSKGPSGSTSGRVIHIGPRISISGRLLDPLGLESWHRSNGRAGWASPQPRQLRDARTGLCCPRNGCHSRSSGSPVKRTPRTH